MKKMNHLLGLMVLGLALSVTSCGKSYTVTFDTNDGSTILAVTVDGKGTVGTVVNPTKEGHNFAGWYLDEAFTQEVDLTTYVPTADVTVYAKWTVESFDINFEENGGTAVSDTTAEYGKPVTLPAAPTKEGYDFVKWYLDEELMQPYANQAIKEDTTLYAKWRSAVVYTGSHTGEAAYNAEDGSYSFTVDLPMWGRFTLMYHGEAIAANDANLTITGLFNPEPAADGTRNLYCDRPEGSAEGTPVDYTTFLCCKPGIYNVTYDPTNNILDIQDGNPPLVIPTEGFYYRYTYGRNVDTSELAKVELDTETNTYSFEVVLEQWRYVEMFYNGEVVDSADVVKNFNINGGNIYIGSSPDPTYYYYSSAIEATKYLFEYTPATADTQAVVTTSLVIDIPETGIYYMYTNADGVLQAPKATTYDEATGSYSFEVELAQWKYAQIICDGVVVDSADENLEYTLASGLYIATEEPSNRFYTSTGGEYRFTYTPATETTKSKLETALVIPSTGVCFAYTNPDNVVLLLSGNKITVEEGVYTVTVDLAQWRYFTVYENGEAIPASAMTVTGDGWVDGTYDKSTNGSLYIDSNPANFLRSQAGVVNYKVSYNPETNALVIDNLALDESEEPSNGVKFDILSTDGGASDSSEIIVWDTANAAIYSNKAYNLANGWRLYIVVDAEGKIAYMVNSPLSGYGNAYSDSYIRHSAYATYTSNPAFTNISEVYKNEWNADVVDYDLVIPAGGFAICAHGNSANAIVQAILGVDASAAINVNTNNVDAVRLSKDSETVTIEKKTITTWALSTDEYAVAYEEASTAMDLGKYRLFVAVDAEGKIAYMCDMPVGGYSVFDTPRKYVCHSDYADYTNNPAVVVDGSNYSIVVPEGGFVISAFSGDTDVQAFILAVTGEETYEEYGINKNATKINVDNVRLSYNNGVVTIIK